MTRNVFDRELNQLNDDLIQMGNMAEEAIEKVMLALREKDKVAAVEVIEGDEVVDAMERRIESRCLKLLLHQQPVARDLRVISTALKMITDIERICDQAADIAEILLRFIEQQYIKEPEHIMMMADIATTMVKRGIDAYVYQDVEMAKKVIAMDDEVDDLFGVIKNELIDLAANGEANKDQIIDFLMIAKYLERIGDHAENIAEWVIFAVTGMHKKERII
ncbi:MAG: phosphate signaling complex protein PhoU [Christensenellales bacterium]